MAHLRPWCWILFAGAAISLGCRGERDNSPAPSSTTDIAADRPVDYLSKARRMYGLGDLDSAADAAGKALLQDPDSTDAKLIAAEVESARGNHQTAAELASSIDLESRLAKKAVDLHYQQLVKLGRFSEAADVLVKAIEAIPGVDQWRHHAWDLLNRVGRREDASVQADVLCRTGEITQPELLSLLRRNDSFPFVLVSESPEKHFEPGLGMARWYFTQRQFERGLQELSEQYENGFSNPAAAALYGRLLAEIQDYEAIPHWYAKCETEVSNHSDYWSALGTYFFDDHQFEASARAFLEARIRDPSDDFTAHRLAKVLDALGRPDDAAQFRNHGVDLVQAEQAAERLIRSPDDSATRSEITQRVLILGRPFEALQWSISSLPPQAVSQRSAMESKRAELSRDRQVIKMAAESALFGLDPAAFRLQPAIDSLGQPDPRPVGKTGRDVPRLATPRLVNVASQVGLDFQWYPDIEINLASIPIHEMMGGAIAVLDYDLDGWPDIYLGQGSGEPPHGVCTRSNVLYRNVDARFLAITEAATVDDLHYSTGISAGDVNQDGLADLFVGSLGPNRLLINNGDGTFRDVTNRLGDVTDRYTTSVAIADINGDSLPDLYECVYIEMEGGFKLPDTGPDGHEVQPTPLAFFPQSDRWFENLGDGNFCEHEIASSVAPPGSALGVVVTDFDSKGRNEVFVANDARPNHFLIQADQNQFRNTADAIGVASGFSGESNACMGIATADFNRDGALDMHVTNFLKESANHYLQKRGGGFSDMSRRYGIDSLTFPFIAFGTKAVDFDRNGWADLVVTNGHVFDMRHAGELFEMPPQLLTNTGSRFESVDVDDESGYWDSSYLGRAMATIDFDRDGAIDLLVGHLDQPLALLHNRTAEAATIGDWIQFELVGTSSERDAIGTRVIVTTGDDQELVAWVTAGDGYLCTDEGITDLGLGRRGVIEKVEFVWPSGQRQSVARPAVKRRYLVVEGQDGIFPRSPIAATRAD